MKQDRHKRLKIVAKKILKLENELAQDKNNKSIQKEIETVMSTLNFEEMLYIDNYIMKHQS